MSVKIVGILLVTALLVLPAAIARLFANSALQMLLLSIICAIVVCAFAGVTAQYYNISAGAFSVLVLSVIFIFGSLVNIKK